tara:strand:+ start:52 stop:822 length:771 start_codon:yes stop_codon:yes gene_type:complete
MSYKNLKNFKNIFQRSDFDYLSNTKNITDICNIILYNVSDPDGKENSYINLISSFLKELDSFYKFFNMSNVQDIKNGYSVCRVELLKINNLLKESDLKRNSISKGYLRKFKNFFLGALSVLLRGIKTSFDPEARPYTNINYDSLTLNQIMALLLDKNVGLGKKFKFNTKGRYAFVSRLKLLNKQQLIVVHRLLFRFYENQIRTIKGWRDFGTNQTPVRILAKRKNIYFLYRINQGEHDAYQDQLNFPPESMPFSSI